MHNELAIWIVREEAEILGDFLAAELGAKIYKPWHANENSQMASFKEVYRNHSGWVMLMASGIAVRFLDGVMKSKLSDPAVVVVDEAGAFAVPLLSGHEGGANSLAARVSLVTGGQPVITTATESLKPLTIGIGMRKGVSCDQIRKAVEKALDGRSIEDVKEIATIDLKGSEPGLLQFVEEERLVLRVFTQQAVGERKWCSRPSHWVKANVGVWGVCEPCALMANPRGRLISTKIAYNGVAVAVVEDVRIGRCGRDVAVIDFEEKKLSRRVKEEK